MTHRTRPLSGARSRHPTSSRAAARAWLRSRGRPASELRLFMQVMRYAARAKLVSSKVEDTRSTEAARERIARDKAKRLMAEFPDLIEGITFKDRGARVLDRSTGAFPTFAGVARQGDARARFSRAVV